MKILKTYRNKYHPEMEPFPVIKRVWQERESRILDEIKRIEDKLSRMRGAQLEEIDRKYPGHGEVCFEEWPEEYQELWNSWEEDIQAQEELLEEKEDELIDTEKYYYSDIDPIELRLLEFRAESYMSEMGTRPNRPWGVETLFTPERIKEMSINSHEPQGAGFIMARHPDFSIPVELVEIRMIGDKDVDEIAKELATHGIDWIELQERLLLDTGDDESIQKNPFATATRRFEMKLEDIDLEHYWDLREIMEALPHLHFRDGYTLDGCMVGDLRNAMMMLYAYRKDSVDKYFPGKDHINPDGDILYDPESKQYFRAFSSKQGEVSAPVPFRDGQVIVGTITTAAFDTVPPIAEYLESEFTPKAIWETLLLTVEAGSYLQHRWHGGYANGRIILDEAALMDECTDKLDSSVIEYLKTEKSYEPEVRILDEKWALVVYGRWDEYNGLRRVTQLALYNGKSIRFKEHGNESLAKYDNGLIF